MRGLLSFRVLALGAALAALPSLTHAQGGPASEGRRLSQAELASRFQGKTLTVSTVGGRRETFMEYLSPNSDRVWRQFADGQLGRVRYSIRGGQFCYTLGGECMDVRQSGSGYVMSRNGRDVYVVTSVVAGDANRISDRFIAANPNQDRPPDAHWAGSDGRRLSPEEAARLAGVAAFLGSAMRSGGGERARSGNDAQGFMDMCAAERSIRCNNR